MLSAGWGAGKTYYIINTFFPQLEDLSYKGIIVSLFGVKTLDDIKDRIFVALYPLIDNRWIKAGAVAGKLLLKAVDISKLITMGLFHPSAGDIQSAGKELGSLKFDFLNLEKLCICFDDLERVDKSLLGETQILGFINGLVEETNVKVIIVANHDRIQSETFRDIQEKTIGNHIHFHQQFDSIFTNMVADLAVGTEKYRQFLLDNKAKIFNALAEGNAKVVNLRTLQYFITYFESVNHFVMKGFQNENFNLNKKKILNNLFRFSLLVCTELKKGTISFTDRKGLDAETDFLIRKIYNLKSDQSTAFADELISKYYPEEDYEYYPNLFDYLTGGSVFSEFGLLKDLRHKYHLEDTDLPKHYQVFKQLYPIKEYDLSDHDYIDLTRQLRDFALLGLYQINEYPTIFYFIMRHGNVLRLNPELLTQRFIKIIKNKLSSHQFHPLMEEHLGGDSNSPLQPYYQKMREVILLINKKAGERQKKYNDKDIELQLKTDFNGTYERLNEAILNNKQLTSFSGINPKSFFRLFLRLDNRNKSKLIVLLQSLYNPSKRSIEIIDFEFINKLKDIVDRKVESLGLKNVSGHLLGEFQKAIGSLSSDLSYFTPPMSN